MAEVRVLSRVKHNGRLYEEGDVIGELSKKQANQLVESGEASTDLEGKKPTTGAELDKRESRVKADLLGNQGGERKTVSEKAQARNARESGEASGDGDDKGEGEGSAPDEPVQLPDAFTVEADGDTPAQEYTVKRNVNDKVSGYQLNGQPIKKAEYQEAYVAHVANSEETEN